MSMVGALISFMVVALIGTAVVIPTVKDSIDNSSIEGSTKTILDQLPLILGVALFAGAVGFIRL